MEESALRADSPATISRAAEVVARCRELARITDVPGETTRLFLSKATHEAHGLLLGWMRAAGLETRVDDTGSLRAVMRSAVHDAPTLILFSHIDTVPNAGAFDGPLGVVLGLAALETLHCNDLPGNPGLPFNIELIAFSEEEGVRFAYPFLSSLAATGQLTPQHLACTDSDGMTAADAVRAFGLDPSRIPATCPLPVDAFAALEIHIEQGPVLDIANERLAVVEGVIGQSRLRLSFFGEANHAGTTPMQMRQDALAAAAEWIVVVERYARSREALVATVGFLEVFPGVVNVVPGSVHATLDVRHPVDAHRRAAVSTLETAAREAGVKRGVRVDVIPQSEQATVLMSSSLTKTLQQSATHSGFPARTMFSGAGHDAMILAPHVPTAMLFVRSPGGLSHHPEESVREQDIAAALTTVVNFLTTVQP
jgi:allantoate deiminase